MLVYRHRSKLTNEVFYVGIGSIKRSKAKTNRSIFWKNFVNKHDYYIEIVKQNLSLDEAKELEEFLILLYGRRDLQTGCLVNMTNGGEGAYGKIVSETTKEKMRLLNKGKKLSEEHKLKISIANKGRCPSLITKIKQKEKASKKVIDLKTKIIYSSAKEVAELFEIKPLTLTRKLSGYTKNKTNFKYYE